MIQDLIRQKDLLLREYEFEKEQFQRQTSPHLHKYSGWQERDIILISMVRNNEQGQVGFLSDLRRMNVAITRARMKLIIIGHSPTLCRHPFYKRLKEYINHLGEY